MEEARKRSRTSALPFLVVNIIYIMRTLGMGRRSVLHLLPALSCHLGCRLRWQTADKKLLHFGWF